MENAGLEPFRFRLLRQSDVQELWHPELEIVFLLRGAGKVFFSDLETAYALKETDVFAVNCFAVRGLELDPDGVALSFLVSSEFVGRVAPELLKRKILCRSFLYEEANQGVFHGLRQKLAIAFRESYKTGDSVIHATSSAAAVLEYILRYFASEKEQVEFGEGQKTMQAITGFIQDHYREKLTLEDLASQTYLSKSYLSRMFSKRLGISFTGYLELLRLGHAKRLLAGGDTLGKIAEESGFPSANALILAFKRYWGVTPGQYRRSLLSREPPKLEDPDAGIALFQTLTVFAEEPAPLPARAAHVQEILVDTGARKPLLPAHWKRLFSAGYAKSLTDRGIQDQLRALQKEVGFEFIRVKGLLDDEMCLLRRDMHGAPTLNYAYLDEVVDVILSTGAKPMLELSFMPGVLAKDGNHASMRGLTLAAPRDVSQWKRLILALMNHLKSRYGGNAIGKWLFSPWFPPDFADMGICTRGEYAEVYAASFQAIREALPRAMIVGPGCATGDWDWFFAFCREKGCMPDILSLRSFATADQQEDSQINLVGSNESFPFAVSKDADILAHSIEALRKKLEAEGLGCKPLVVEEWSSTVWQRDLCNDTCYKSAYLFKNILENNHRVGALGYFSLNDRLEEIPPASETFHGGFGLFTQDGIPKSAYYAMVLLSRLGDKLLSQGDGYLISQRGEEIQIYLYNYKHYDLLYRYHHMANIQKTRRDQVFVDQEAAAFCIQLQSLPRGSYTLCRYAITPQGGSSYDQWVRMGAPSPLRPEERERLIRLSIPEYTRETMAVSDGVLSLKINLAPQDVCLICVQKEDV